MYAAEEVLDHAHTQNNRHFCRRMTAERRVGVVLSWACTGYNQGGGQKRCNFIITQRTFFVLYIKTMKTTFDCTFKKRLLDIKT